MDDDNNIKSKSLTSLLILISITVISAFIPASWLGIHPAIYRDKPLDLSAITSAGEIAKDTNGDGVIDWQEVIRQTFPTSTTTDSTENTTIDKKAIAALNDAQNLTGDFSKNLYLASTYINENGGADANTQQTVLDNLISQEASKIAVTNYTYNDIKVAKTEDKTSLRAYGNNIAPILQAVVTKKIMIDDMSSVNSFIQTQKESDLSTLIKNRDRVNVLLQKLLSISVPPSAISYHILALNRIASYRDTLDNLSKAGTDPIRAKLAIEQYSQVMVMILRIPNQFSNYFNLQNIVFSTKEAGYMFTIGYTISN